ncbi:MAG: hypothetical protein NDJ72_03715, partial [Elusimicrobia bacterium]|nr:hypothetical protein [Elusimicrobiota bacterium]
MSERDLFGEDRLLELDAPSAEPLTRWSLFGVSARRRLAESAGRWSAEARALDAELARRPTPARFRRRGELRLRLGCPDGAAEDLALAGESPPIRFLRATALIQLGRSREAIPLLESALEHPGAALWRAEALLRAGRRAQGLRALERLRRGAASFVPDLLLGRRGRPEALDEAVALAPREAWPR